MKKNQSSEKEFIAAWFGIFFVSLGLLFTAFLGFGLYTWVSLIGSTLCVILIKFRVLENKK